LASSRADSQFNETSSNENITSSDTSHGDEEDQHGRPTHQSNGGGPVILKLESISKSGAVLGKIDA